MSSNPVHAHSDDPFAYFDFGAFETDEQPGDTEDPFSTQPQPDFAGPSSDPSPIQNPITPLPVITTVNRWPCPMCPETFRREQERNRHELTHIPFFLHCPLPHCPWRGNHIYSFKKHWQKADHLSYHQHYGHAPEGYQIETFNPHVILQHIKDGAISLTDGEDIAIALVELKGHDLEKLSMWKNLWGRKRL